MKLLQCYRISNFGTLVCNLYSLLPNTAFIINLTFFFTGFIISFYTYFVKTD